MVLEQLFWFLWSSIFRLSFGLWGSIFLGVMGSMGVMGLILSIGLLWLFVGKSPVPESDNDFETAPYSN
jgi:hypothetical protein